MVPGFDALAGKLRDKSTYFSFSFKSTMLTVIGNKDLNTVAVVLSCSVAVNVLIPILIFILPPVGFVLVLLFPGVAVSLSADAQLVRKENAHKTSKSSRFITLIEHCYASVTFFFQVFVDPAF